MIFLLSASRKVFSSFIHPDEIIELCSQENEIIKLSHTLFATENIEGWLNELEAAMFETVYDKTKLCLEKYPFST